MLPLVAGLLRLTLDALALFAGWEFMALSLKLVMALIFKSLISLLDSGVKRTLLSFGRLALKAVLYFL